MTPPSRRFCRPVLTMAALWSVLSPSSAGADETQPEHLSPPPLQVPESQPGAVAPALPAAPPPRAPPPPADPDALAVPSEKSVGPHPGPVAVEPSQAPIYDANTTSSAAPPSVQESATPGADAASSRALTTLPSLTGPIGLFHASTADVGPAHQLRLGLHGEFFGASGFLINGDSNQRLAGDLVLGYTLRRDVELFGAILNSSNRNRRRRDVNDRDPELIKTFGDLIVGGKWILPLSPAATLGVELGLKFLSGVSDLAVSPSSTSWWLGPVFTYDLRRDTELPLRLHAGASFFADNSSNLHGLSGVTRSTREVAMFAYGMAPSRLRFALAAEAPLQKLFPRVPVTTFLEYHLAYVTSDADLAFRDYMKPNCDSSDSTKMPCVDNRDLQWVTLGVRAVVYRGITVDLGIDIRIRSAGFPYGPPVPPWNLLFGLSYPLDIDSLTRTVIVTRTIEKPAPAAEGQIVGVARNARTGAVVPGAVVAVAGRTRARVAADPDGGFATGQLPAGPAALEISAPNFDTAKVSATVIAGKATEVAVALVPQPPTVRLSGRVTDAAGKGIEASVKFAGDEIREARSESNGAYSSTLPPGSYQVRVDAPGLVPAQSQVDLALGQDRQLDFILAAPVSNPNVVLVEDAIKLKKPIRFVGSTATLTPASQKLLDAVADLLNANAEFKRVEIVAHWDSGAQKADAAMLTQHQAEAVRGYLVNHGVAESRLIPIGAGSSKPLVPNLGPVNRARNRRVDLNFK